MATGEDILKGLNEKQREAVVALDGPVLVLAGAGSGKTRALTHRLAYLVSQKKAMPENLLAVTFTNKAAAEMKQRVIDLVGSEATKMTLGTFHSIGARILREAHTYTSRTAGFTIMDTQDSERLIKKALDTLHLPAKMWPPKKMRHYISNYKMDGVDFERDEIRQLYELYEKMLAEHDSFDFDDLIRQPLLLLRENKSVRQTYQARWKYVAVDEYQDTNAAQEELISLMLGPEKNICVVGDDYQAIYSWRGARVDHILNFEKRHPEAKVVYLTQNYRSTGNILEASNQVIAENEGQKHKELWTDRADDEPVKLSAHMSDRHEAAAVREAIQSAPEEGTKAILYRTNAQSRLFEEELIRNRIPYVIIGGMRFYDRAEVKDAMAFLQLLGNPKNTIALQRIVDRVVKGVGPKTINGLSGDLIDALNSGSLTARQAQAMSGVLRALNHAREELEEGVSLDRILLNMLETAGYTKYLDNLPDEESEERKENVDELVRVAMRFDSLERMLEEVALLSDADKDHKKIQVVCMTLHAAKGLEFDYVHLVGLEEGTLPHMNSIGEMDQLEEERRLMYVGMTRAKKTLSLSWAHQRMVHGGLESRLPSRFLEALPERAVERDDFTPSYDELSVQSDDLIDFVVPGF